MFRCSTNTYNNERLMAFISIPESSTNSCIFHQTDIVKLIEYRAMFSNIYKIHTQINKRVNLIVFQFIIFGVLLCLHSIVIPGAFIGIVNKVFSYFDNRTCSMYRETYLNCLTYRSRLLHIKFINKDSQLHWRFNIITFCLVVHNLTSHIQVFTDS